MPKVLSAEAVEQYRRDGYHFPIPILDGGHLLFYMAEAVRGKPLGPRAQEYGVRIGLALVLSLMVFATFHDLVHFRVLDF